MCSSQSSPLFAFLFEAPSSPPPRPAAAVSIPIIIHLLNRKRYRVVPWAAMRFLLAAQRKTSRKVRIEQLLLLVVRCLLLLLLLAAMCSVTPWAEAAWRWFRGRPAFAVAGGAARTHKILVVDGSLGMGFKAGDKDCFEKARAAAKQIVQRQQRRRRLQRRPAGRAAAHDRARPDRSTATPACRPRTPKRCSPASTTLRRTDGNADLAAALNTVEDLLEASPSEICRKRGLFPDESPAHHLGGAPGRRPVGHGAEDPSPRPKRPRSSTWARTAPRTWPSRTWRWPTPSPRPATTRFSRPFCTTSATPATTWPVRPVVRKAGADGEAMDLPVLRADCSGDQGRRTGPRLFQHKFPDPGDYVVRVRDRPRRSGGGRRPPRRGDGQGRGAGAAGQRQAGRPGLRRAADLRPPGPQPLPGRKRSATRPRTRRGPPKVLDRNAIRRRGTGRPTPYDCVFLCDMPNFTARRPTRGPTPAEPRPPWRRRRFRRRRPRGPRRLQRRALPPRASVCCPLASSRSNPRRTPIHSLGPPTRPGRRAGLQTFHRFPAARAASGAPLPPVPHGGAGPQGPARRLGSGAERGGGAYADVVQGRPLAWQASGQQSPAGRPGGAGVAAAGRQGCVGSQPAARPRRPVHHHAERRLEHLAGVNGLASLFMDRLMQFAATGPAARTGHRRRRTDRAVRAGRQWRRGLDPHAGRP